MKIIKMMTFLAVIAIFGTALQGQVLLKPNYSFSTKKTAYIILEDGTEIQGTIKGLDFKKGLIEEIKIKDLEGKKHKFEPEEIKHMYLPPSGFDKFLSAYDFLYDPTQWDNTDLDRDIIGKGYAFFEKSKVKIKKKTEVLLLQLLNPSFCSTVKIYFDPFAKETMRVGVAGFKVAGGKAKSYYFKEGDNVAYKIKKKDYDDEFKLIFKSCKSLISKYGKNPKWSDLEKHVIESKKCN